jgi:hypothetical protein
MFTNFKSKIAVKLPDVGTRNLGNFKLDFLNRNQMNKTSNRKLTCRLNKMLNFCYSANVLLFDFDFN